MGRPIDKKFFGPDAGGDGFQITGTAFFGAGPAEACYVVRQRSNRKFEVADVATGLKIQVCKLVDGAPVADGEMRIAVNTTESAKKITAHRIYSFAGEMFVWSDITKAATIVDDAVDADLGDDVDVNP